jgi:hypothetical protein
MARADGRGWSDGVDDIISRNPSSVHCCFLAMGLVCTGDSASPECFSSTVILFGCQMIASTWWLARFRFGPAEMALATTHLRTSDSVPPPASALIGVRPQFAGPR